MNGHYLGGARGINRGILLKQTACQLYGTLSVNVNGNGVCGYGIPHAFRVGGFFPAVSIAHGYALARSCRGPLA